MAIAQISPNSMNSVNPYQKTSETQPVANQQANQDAQKPVKATQTDTVTISQQALQMTGSGNNATDKTKNAASDQQKQQQQQQQMQQQQQQPQMGSFSVQG